MIDLNIILGAMEDATAEYVYRRKNEHVFDTFDPEYEECSETEELISLPTHAEINEYGMMERFAGNVVNEMQKEWLTNSLVGKGAFRRFRSCLERFGMTEDWYVFREREYRYIAEAWCEDNGIVYERIERDDPIEKEFDWNDEEQFKPAEETVVKERIIKEPVRCVLMTKKNINLIASLYAQYCIQEDRKFSRHTEMDYEEAEEEMQNLIASGCEIYGASDNGLFAGFIILEYNGDTVVPLAIFVRENMRRKGIGRQLMRTAEEKGTVYPLVSPHDEKALLFLKKTGYGTVERVELSKGNVAEDVLQIFKQEFKC